MDIIFRNLQRLVFSDEFFGKESIEPMSEWKWNKLYELSIAYGIGPWIADGFRRYSDDFFLQPSETLRYQFLALDGDRNEAPVIAIKRSLPSSSCICRVRRAS